MTHPSLRTRHARRQETVVAVVAAVDREAEEAVEVLLAVAAVVVDSKLFNVL
jgi:hypothetical protein